MNFKGAKAFILHKLENELSEKLTYHKYEHTLDVYEQTKVLAKEEGISSKIQLQWLKTAALFHDSGFLNVYKDHEIEGCRIAAAVLPDFGYTSHDIEMICGMIMATKIPQSPKNPLEQIIADADLDYLGRDDFYEIGDTLRQELRNMGIIQSDSEWNPIQIEFLSAHHYFTSSSIKKRAAQKDKYMQELILKEKLNVAQYHKP